VLANGSAAADTDSSTPMGLPSQEKEKLATFVNNVGASDGVSRNGPQVVAATHQALVAPGRNPAPIMIPVLAGSEGSAGGGGGGDDEEAEDSGENGTNLEPIGVDEPPARIDIQEMVMRILDELHAAGITPVLGDMPNDQGKKAAQRFADVKAALIKEFPPFALGALIEFGGMFFGPEDAIFIALAKSKGLIVKFTQTFTPKGAKWVGELLTKAGKRLTSADPEYKALMKEYDDATASIFSVGRTHREAQGLLPNTHSHHGVMSAWMEANFKNYNPWGAPTIVMPAANHRATVSLFNKWKAQMAAKMGATFDWANVSEAEMRALAEKMLDAAHVPPAIRQEYWQAFERMKAALTP
jgi:hypothetical protein